MSNMYLLNGISAELVKENTYEKEKVLQDIVTENPYLLLRKSDPEGTELILIKNEQGMDTADEEDSTLSLDHLMVDSNGVLVLVECKRASNKEIRREIVAQMLDYASRVSVLCVNELRDSFRKKNESKSRILEIYDTDEFWEKVETNIKAEKMRFAFVADRIPHTLKLIIDFLDRKLESIDVYGVEVVRYQNEDATLLDVDTIENTIADAKKNRVREEKQWTMESMVDFLLDHNSSIESVVLKRIVPAMEQQGWEVRFGSGPKIPKCILKRPEISFTMSPWNNGKGCVVEFSIDKFLKAFFGDWDKERFIEIFHSIPKGAELFEADMIWVANGILYMDLKAFNTEENFAYLNKVFGKITELLKE